MREELKANSRVSFYYDYVVADGEKKIISFPEEFINQTGRLFAHRCWVENMNELRENYP